MMASNVLHEIADVSTLQQGEEVREALVEAIWRSDKRLPSRRPDSVVRDVAAPVSSVSNLAGVDRLNVIMDQGFWSSVHHFIPQRRVNRLILVHQGHNSSWNQGVKQTIRQFVADGFDVLAFQMPGYGWARTPFNTNHNRLAGLETSELNPVKYFLEPISVSLAHVDVESFEDVAMTGLSGGGWTTTLYAAVDPRIQYSFAVAGSLPRFLRTHDRGDWEQHDAGGIYDNVAGYLELYVLAGMGEGREHVQILNHGDPCCFDGASGRHNAYDDILSRHLTDMGEGAFRVVIDPNNQHSISAFARRQMMDVLNAGGTVIDDGAVGYQHFGDWRRWRGNGLNKDLNFAAAGTGSDTASWEYSVVPGIYTVSTTWSPHPNRATNAPYSVFDGTELVGQQSVNQRVAASGFTYQGVPWTELGTFEIRSNRLRVMLNNRADGYVIADAVQIERVADLPRPPDPEPDPVSTPVVGPSPPIDCTGRCARTTRSARLV